MARIWFSVAGEGWGHAIRSSILIKELVKRHDVAVTAAEISYPFLRKKFGRIVRRIHGFRFVYENNEVSATKTLAEGLKKLPTAIVKNTVIIRELLREFRPDIIVADFEPFAHYAALLTGIPIISVDNNHALTQLKIRIPKKHAAWAKAGKALIRVLHPKTDFWIIPSFVELEPAKKGRVVTAAPLIREEFKRQRPESREHVLVYQTSPTNEAMLEVLKETRNTYVVYGMRKRKISPRIVFKDFSEKEFIRDIASARYVILNGGFTVISEALYLKKPVLAIPIRKQAEQLFNAACLRRAGYGDYTEALAKKDIERFEGKLGFFKQNLEKKKEWTNTEFFVKLENAISELLEKWE